MIAFGKLSKIWKVDPRTIFIRTFMFNKSSQLFTALLLALFHTWGLYVPFSLEWRTWPLISYLILLTNQCLVPTWNTLFWQTGMLGLLFTSRLKRKKKTQTDLHKLFCEDRFEANSKEGKKQACCHLAIVHQVCKRKNRLLRMCISADTTCSASSCCLRNVFDDNCISFFFFFYFTPNFYISVSYSL